MDEFVKERRKDVVCNYTSGDYCHQEGVGLDFVHRLLFEEVYNRWKSGYEGFKRWEELLLKEFGLTDHHDGRVFDWGFCHFCLGLFQIKLA